MSLEDEFRALLHDSDSPSLVAGCGMICEAAGHSRAREILEDQFDTLSMTVGGTDLIGVVRSLRDELGFDGDSQNYDDPINSMLHLVIERRRGLPILLAVVVHEVCRRKSIPASIIGMPGHVLVSDGAAQPTYVDPFHSAHPMSAGGARGLYETMTGLSNFSESFLDPLPNRAVLWRILNNLLSRYRRTGELANVRWVMRLRSVFPDVGPEFDREFARLMGPMN
ncbi:MAG: hypothetical protein EBZ00_00465 [Actinobacteria bacterium]|nr:hypothetical protein [Actinomycetota bacterium]